MEHLEKHYEVVIVGGGNAALAAAIAAAQKGVKVAMLEKAPKDLRGGNSYFTGNYRFSWTSLDEDILPLIPTITDAEITEMRELAKPHPQELFYEDVMRITEGYANPGLIQTLVSESLPTMKWLRSLGHEWIPKHRDPSSDFMVVRLNGGGARVSDRGFSIADKLGIDVHYENAAMDLLRNNRGHVNGVYVLAPEGLIKIYAKGVILACGGFEANAGMRASYLGEGWDRVKTRGVPYNTGDGLRMAWNIGAQPYGHLTACHSLPQDMNCPRFCVRTAPINYTRRPFPWGILVNSHGKRFVDESLSRLGYTNGELGKAMVLQPNGGVAYQILDKKTEHLLKKYDNPMVTAGTANTLEELADFLGLEVQPFIQTVQEFNRACPPATPVDRLVPDGRGTKGLTIPKANWALPIDTPPFRCLAIGCGITFTYGGLHIDTDAQVLSNWEAPIPGLYACGEILGGLWYQNYPSGCGMSQGATFGRIAGINAAAFAKGH